jgi:hypothetical protein
VSGAAQRKEKKGDWVIVGGKPGEVAYCTRCGEGLTLNMPQRIEVFVAASNAFVNCHKNCPPGKHFEKPATTPEEWALSRDTGVSSFTIYAAITGRHSPYHFDVPHDPDDFGRCYRLLKIFPSWRAQLSKTVELHEAWKPFIEQWDELTSLFEGEFAHGSGPDYKLFNRIRELRGQK